MAIDKFSRTRFEQVLDGICTDLHFRAVKSLGLQGGELVYDLVIDHKTSVRIRSSIDRTGFAADAGFNSIRLWLIHHVTDTQLSKLDRNYITRMHGWDAKLFDECAHLQLYRRESGDCPQCKHPMYVYRSKSAANEGRLFTSCFNCKKTFYWLEANPYGNILTNHKVYFEPEHESEPVEFASSTGEEPNPHSPWASGEQSSEESTGWSPVAEDNGSSPDEQADQQADNQADILDSLEEEEEQEELPLTIKQERQPNEQQAQAIYAPISGAYRVLAPPGSGKTFLLVRRVRYLLEQGINMGNILTVTFTAKMAAELLNKLVELMPELKENQFADRNVCTIHAACYRMLKDYGDPRRYMEADRWKLKQFLQEQAVKHWKDEEIRPTWKEIQDWIYTAKSHGIEPDAIMDFFSRALGSEYMFGMAQIYRDYDDFMRVNKWLLFPDMLYEVEMLLRHDPVFLRRYQTLYKYILIDEGQDTSGQAMRILTTLAAPQDNFFIVGDPDQLLYRFAGATPEVNLQEGFESRFPNGTLIKLTTNYRSVPAVVELCNQLIGNNYSDAGGPYDQKYMKDVRAHRTELPDQPVTFSLLDGAGQEAFDACADIQNLLHNGYKPGDIFVGARTRAQLTYLEPHLMKAEIPFINIAGSSFWGSRHIQDMLSFLKVAADPYDEQAFSRIYNIASNEFDYPWGDQKGEYCSHHFLPRQFIALVKNYRQCRLDVRAYNFQHKFSWKPGMQDIVDLVTEVVASLEQEGVYAALQTIANECYLKYLRFELGLESEGDGGPIDDINTFIAFSLEFQSAKEFIAYVELAREQAEKAAEKSMESWKDYVILSTIHRLKGLERPVVMGLGMVEGYKPGPYDTRTPAGLLPHTFSLIEPPNLGVFPGSSKGRIEDERCCAFVLISRAMERVYLYGSERYQGAVLHPSRFIKEIGLDKWETLNG